MTEWAIIAAGVSSALIAWLVYANWRETKRAEAAMQQFFNALDRAQESGVLSKNAQDIEQSEAK